MNTRRMNEGILEIVKDDKVVMSLSEKMDGDAMVIKVFGELVNEVSHEFEDELMAAFSVCDTVKVDFSETKYIASIAMRALLNVQQIIDENDNAALIITALSPKVKEVFEESGFMDILCIEE